MLTTGTTAPDFALSSKTADGLNLVKLSDHQGKNVVLLFFPMVYTSVCTDEFCAVSKGLSDFAGAEVIGISGDNPFAKKLGRRKKASPSPSPATTTTKSPKPTASPTSNSPSS